MNCTECSAHCLKLEIDIRNDRNNSSGSEHVGVKE